MIDISAELGHRRAIDGPSRAGLRDTGRGRTDCGGVWFNSRIDDIASNTGDLDGRVAEVADESKALADRLATVSDKSDGVESDFGDMLEAQSETLARLDTQTQEMAEDNGIHREPAGRPSSLPEPHVRYVEGSRIPDVCHIVAWDGCQPAPGY